MADDLLKSNFSDHSERSDYVNAGGALASRSKIVCLKKTRVA